MIDCIGSVAPAMGPTVKTDLNDGGSGLLADALVRVTHASQRQIDFLERYTSRSRSRAQVAIGTGDLFGLLSGRSPTSPRWIRRSQACILQLQHPPDGADPVWKWAIMRARFLALGIMIGALLAGGLVFGLGASGSTATKTYFACVTKGTLSKVGTTQPTCAAPSKLISWNSVGPQGPPGPPGPPGQGVAYQTDSGSKPIPVTGVDSPSPVMTQVLPTGGDFEVTANLYLYNAGSSFAGWACQLVAANPGGQWVSLDSNQSETPATSIPMTLVGMVSIAAGGSVRVQCQQNISTGGNTAGDVKIISSQVSGFQTVKPS